MKLRVRINKQTSRVELVGAEPSVTELRDHIKETVLSSHGLSSDTEFSLSLNGTEPLSDAGQTLSSCGIVSGDLICVILPESVAVAAPSSAQQAANNTAAQSQQQNQTRQSTAMASSQDKQPSASSTVESKELEDNNEEENHGTEISSWEPMLCSEAEEGQVPFSLELLYHGAQSRSPSDTLMVAVNLLMLETGFIPQGSEMKPGEMPSGWRAAGGVYKLQYTHPLCESSLVMLVAVSMGPMLVINATLRMNEKVDVVHKLSVNPSSYVTDEFQGENAAGAFKDLGKLSRIFKDQVAYPLIAAAREALALPVVFGLGALPPELLLRVLRLLDVQSLVALSSASRHFHSTTSDSTLWRHLYHRDFRDQDPSRSRDTDWKELYKRKYKLRKEYRRMARPYVTPPIHPIPSNPFNPFIPSPLYPPGIIGGEYDQRPNIPQGILPQPRFDPIGPLPDHSPARGGLGRWRGPRPMGSRPTDIRRGFI
ncbi:F-box only protein 7 isoform X2 [Myripristis murdjan]|uniref:F-box protein 7 n=1 Tax=Myripristis murdjan TaxID=586833 RepID=A0A667Y8X7_9TELE|nr:F-box only protein 7 isoform X2 [Myripristis murdjan]